MKAVAQNQMPVTRATLNKAISYNKDGVTILINAKTEILVDAEQEIALIGLDHVHMTQDEYTLV